MIPEKNTQENQENVSKYFNHRQPRIRSRNSAEGAWRKTDWFRVTAFGKQAETLARYVRKGSRLYVQGRLTFNPWVDQNESPQAGAEIVLQEFQFLSGRRDENGDGAAMQTAQTAPVELQQAAAY
ncbi:MAG: single-stranded DNA-binding protein [Acidobacteria bacterium]|nr:single-stranded DNA-binding protein [Acidobacteriota bacterium]